MKGKKGEKADTRDGLRAQLAPWMERDLTADAEAGLLAPAFCVESTIESIAAALGSGLNPVLAGASGVGKTAIWHEVVRRVRAGEGPPELAGRRIVQLSIRLRAAGLKKPEELRPAMHGLVEALVAAGGDVVPYFRDIHLAYRFDLEPNLEALALRLPGPVLGEGEAAVTRSLFEDTQELAEEYLPIVVEEPGLEATTELLACVSDRRRERGLGIYEADAIETAIALSHRFLARGHFPRKALTLLEQAAASRPAGQPVTSEDVLARFASGLRVPRFLIDPSIPLDLGETSRTFASRLLGQDDAVEAVVTMIGLMKAGLSDLRRPFGVFLFVGPTGVGKTHLAQTLAEYLFGSRDRLVRVNMADYQAPADALTLFGNPDAYAASGRRGVLTQRLSGHPFAVVLFDEFEKAHASVLDRFLQLMDEGAFINGAGETVSCRSNILIATSNAGADVYRGKYLGFSSPPDPAEVRRAVDRALRQHFRVEFLNRLDRVAHFRPLAREDIRTIALRELELLQDRPGLRRRGISLEIDESVLDWLTAHGYDANHGARFLRRVIERHVTGPIAQVLVAESLEPGERIELFVRRDRVVAEAPRRRPARQVVALPEGRGEVKRSLDRDGLVVEAREQLEAARGLLDGLSACEKERVEMLARMNADDFWDSADQREVLERYRALDVAVQVRSRFAGPLRRLRDTLEELDVPVERLARHVEAAARGLSLWRERQARDAADEVWLLLSAAEASPDGADFLAELVAVEQAWCVRLGLSVEVAAWQDQGGALRRVALAVHGEAAEHLLGLEAGQHRRPRKDAVDARVRVDLVVRGSGSERAGRVESARHRPGPLGAEARHRGRLALTQRGITLSLLGPDEEALRELLRDLAVALEGPADSAPVARLYGVDGLGARDPRTGASVPKARDVKAGRLDPLLEAFRRAGA